MAMEFENLLQHVSAFSPDEVSIGRGEVLFRQGDSGDDFYIVTGGRLRAVYDLGGSDERVVGEIGRGEPVGEMAVIGDCERGATVIAVRPTHLLRVSKAAFDHLRAEHPDDLIDLLAVIARRMKRTYDSGQDDPLPSCIAIVPTNAAVPIDEYCKRFIDALPVSGRNFRLLSSRDVPSDVSGGDDSELRVARWLNEQESSTEMIVLQSDADLTPWSRCCIRQADLVLLVGKAGSDPRPGVVEAALYEFSVSISRPRVELVLLQESQPYSGTADWLAVRPVEGHHHVRLDSQSDRERLHRILAHQRVNLVLGGGGARGLAHIGVVRACQELGITIDHVGGTSIGSLIGAWVAQGADWQEIAAAMRHGFPAGKKMRSRTLPTVSVDTGQRYLSAVTEMFGGMMIEDLPISYFCVSCNVSRAKVMAHRSGLLANWVLTSMSIPGVAPPYVLNGELLVDGGVLNNLPVDLASEGGGGRVIGVDVSLDTDLTYPEEMTGRPGNWEALCSWMPAVSRNRPRSPGMFALFNRISTLSSASGVEKNRARADDLIRVPVNGYKIFEWEKIDELIELGYQSAMEQLDGRCTAVEK